MQLLTPVHPEQAALRRSGLEEARPIVIGNDVWIGGGAILLPGIMVGDRSIVGAGSVVTRDVEPDCVVVGNPARLLRRIEQEEVPDRPDDPPPKRRRWLPF